MNYLKIVILVLALAAYSVAKGQDKKTVETTFKVEGVCGQCKTRIENAAYIKGVKFAVWDKETKVITVAYRPAKTTIETIQKSIAKAGHDTEDLKANEESYHNLPACCSYRSEHIHDH